MTTVHGRGPSTVEPLNKVSIDVHLVDQPLPLMYTTPAWEGVAAYLASTDFREVADQVQFITITNRRSNT